MEPAPFNRIEVPGAERREVPVYRFSPFRAADLDAPAAEGLSAKLGAALQKKIEEDTFEMFYGKLRGQEMQRNLFSAARGILGPHSAT